MEPIESTDGGEVSHASNNDSHYHPVSFSLNLSHFSQDQKLWLPSRLVIIINHSFFSSSFTSFSFPSFFAHSQIPDDGDTVQLLLKPAMLAKVLLTWKSKGKRGEEILLYCKEDDEDTENEQAKKISGLEDVEDGQAIEKQDPHEEDS